jgi:hypothetical protein
MKYHKRLAKKLDEVSSAAVHKDAHRELPKETLLI